MVIVIAKRLARLSLGQLSNIAHLVAEWMVEMAERFYGDAAPALESLWNRLIEALSLGGADPRTRKPNHSWPDEALDAPVGNLFNFLMKDPAKNALNVGSGFPLHWRNRIDQLLGLPGRLRQQALVMISYQLNWLFNIDPIWCEGQVIKSATKDVDDSEAFWQGFFWAARSPSPELFLKLKAELIARTRKSDFIRNDSNVLSYILLEKWGNYEIESEEKHLITDVELREILIHADDEFRRQMLWHIGRLLAANDGIWQYRLIPFLKHVWPRQRALRNPVVSASLVDLALSSGNKMPDVVKVILPRLVPAKRALQRISLPAKSAEDHPAKLYPIPMLDLLWAILAEDPALWPYKTHDIIDSLAEDPATRSDSRLSELRRRRRYIGAG
jgi:hypothetical protein